MYSFLYILLMGLIAYYLGTNRKKNGFDGAYSGVMVGFFISYALVPFLFHTFSSFYIRQSSWKYAYIQKLVFGSNTSDLDIVLAIICVIIGLFGFNCGYKKTLFFGSLEFFKVYKNNSIDKKIKLNEKIFKKIAIIVLIVCTSLLILYIKAFGGLASAFSVADMLRSHTINVSNFGLSGIYSYVFLICGLLPFSFALLLSDFKNNKSFSTAILLILSVISTFIYLRLNSGKSGFIRFGIIIAYLLSGKKIKKHFWWYVFFGGIILLPVLDLFDIWFAGGEASLSLFNITSILENVVPFESPTELNYNLIEITRRYGYQFFKHYILDFIDILPGISFNTSWEKVSEFVRGVDWANKGGTPNDIITYGYLQLNIIGVFIHLFIVGQISSFVDRCNKNIDIDAREVISICFCSNFISFVTCSDISSTFLHNLFFTGLLIFVFYMNRKWART